jgi:hypothetical protein
MNSSDIMEKAAVKDFHRVIIGWLSAEDATQMGCSSHQNQHKHER